jgi:hypothetical protein
MMQETPAMQQPQAQVVQPQAVPQAQVIQPQVMQAQVVQAQVVQAQPMYMQQPGYPQQQFIQQGPNAVYVTQGRKRMSSQGWCWVVILLIIFWPLCWLVSPLPRYGAVLCSFLVVDDGLMSVCVCVCVRAAQPFVMDSCYEQY